MARQRLSYPLRIPFPLPHALARATAALAVLALFALLTFDPALTALGNYLVVDDLPSEADAIVVLSGDRGARLEQGVELYSRATPPALMLAGGRRAGQALRRRGDEAPGRQPWGSRLRDPAGGAVHLHQGGRHSSPGSLMAADGIKSAILVTSPYHQRRAALTFARAFAGSGISVASYPVQDDQWQADSWWRSRTTCASP